MNNIDELLVSRTRYTRRLERAEGDEARALKNLLEFTDRELKRESATQASNTDWVKARDALGKQEFLGGQAIRESEFYLVRGTYNFCRIKSGQDSAENYLSPKIQELGPTLVDHIRKNTDPEQHEF